MLEIDRTRSLLEQLGPGSSALALDNCLNQAAKSESTYLSFLDMLLESERVVRQQRSL